MEPTLFLAVFRRRCLPLRSWGIRAHSRVELRVVLGDFFSLVWPLILLPTTTWPRTRCSTVQCTRQTAPPLSVQSHRKHVGNGRPPMQFNCPPRASKRKGCRRTVCHCSSTHNCSEKCKGRDIRYRHSAIYGNEGRGLVWSSRHVTFCRSLGRPTW